MKRTLLTLLAALALLPALADEGMWLPSLISERIDDICKASASRPKTSTRSTRPR